MIKLSIFDWSGVIKNSVESHLWAVNYIFRKYGVKEISLEDLQAGWIEPYMLFYNRYLPDLNIKEEQAAYTEAIENKDYPRPNAYPGIAQFIREIKDKGIITSVVSADLPVTILPEIKEYGLENIFTDVLINIYGKADAVRSLVNKYGVNPSDVFFIGDSNHEIETSRETGIRSVAVTWGFCSEARLIKDKPDFLVHNLNELRNIINNQVAP